jgi:hypothetical protein
VQPAQQTYQLSVMQEWFWDCRSLAETILASGTGIKSTPVGWRPRRSSLVSRMRLASRTGDLQ